MNFQEVYKKIRSIDEGIDECGGMPIMAAQMSPSKQEDTVSMNVTINGSGSNGIRDLMSILRDIEGNDSHGDTSVLHSKPSGMQDPDEPLLGDIVKSMASDVDEVIGDDEESWGNSAPDSSGHHTHGIDAVTFTGDDMNSKGSISPASRAPGSNPLRSVSESLVSRLAQHYEEIKNS
jgi:hypothetical protein